MALAVIALALSALVKMGSMNADNAAYLRDKTIGQWVALNRITELQLSSTWSPLGQTNGAVEMAGREWFWRSETKATPDESTRRYEIRVFAAEQDEDAVAFFVAFLAKPS